ncbi:uroporphyrin-III C-methyltransferase [Rhodotorula kratochvilovae]
MPSYPAPQPGASLLLAFTPAALSPSSSRPQTLLLLGPTRLSALRAFAALEAGYRVVIGAAAPPSPDNLHEWDPELAHRFALKQVETIPWTVEAAADGTDWRAWFDGAESAKHLADVRMIVLTDTIVSPSASSSSVPARLRRTLASAKAFRHEAEKRRFLVNIADCPDLSDFGWMVSHRFDLDPPSPSGTRKSPLQLALTTNSSACRLATRLRREIVAALPKSAGAAVEAVGRLRDELKAQAQAQAGEAVEGEDDSEETQGVGLNRPVEQLTRAKSQALDGPSAHNDAWTASSAQLTRMRYVSQLSEYWPLDRLATVSLASISAPSTPTAPLSPRLQASYHDLEPAPPTNDLALSPPPAKKGRVLLLGTGPGNPLLLTRVAHLLLTTEDPSSPFFVDLFLSDKLVPPQILALIPPARRAGVVIARKYPGNAEAAQEELMALAIEGAQRGQTVMRMKQGDPYLYGRGGEEVLRFRAVAGIESVVVPGLSSSLAGPTLAGIPVTQRGVAESVVVCTGVGRGGRDVPLAPYERAKTLCVLMGVARLSSLVQSLMNHSTNPYPPYLPIALVERASSPDQRVVASTIDRLAQVLEQLPPHRPPGMIVVGWAVMCLDGEGDMRILDDPEDDGREERDRARVDKWAGEMGYRVREGLSEGWMSLVGGLEAEGEQVSA